MVMVRKKLQAVAVAKYRILFGEFNLSIKGIIETINWIVTAYLPQRNLKSSRYTNL
jgi:hypothetical protein